MIIEAEQLGFYVPSDFIDSKLKCYLSLKKENKTFILILIDLISDWG